MAVDRVKSGVALNDVIDCYPGIGRFYVNFTRCAFLVI
jgi:hypothetical protein